MADRTEPLIQFIQNLKKLEEAKFTMAAVALTYIGIDMVSFLSLPKGKTKTTRGDFINWVDMHMKGHPEQPYQYRGKDLYAARCGLLHSFGIEAEMQKKDPDILLVAYHNGGKHMFKKEIHPRLVLLGSASLVNDFVAGVEQFLKEAEKNTASRQRIWERLTKLYNYFPITRLEK